MSVIICILKSLIECWVDKLWEENYYIRRRIIDADAKSEAEIAEINECALSLAAYVHERVQAWVRVRKTLNVAVLVSNYELFKFVDLLMRVKPCSTGNLSESEIIDSGGLPV